MPHSTTILIVEDDPAIRRGLRDALAATGYRALDAHDGRAGLDAALAAGTAAAPNIDLVLLDILMPRMDGMEVLRQLRRARPTLPVIFLTARGQEEDRVAGLRAGADDYIVKPFSLTELLARVEAVLRRSPSRSAPLPHLDLAGRRIDLDRRHVTHDDGQTDELTAREAELLAYLAAAQGRPVSRDELLQHVWGLDPRGVTTRTVDMAVARLRTALRCPGEGPAAVILTLRGKGYMLAQPTPAPRPGDA